jgi:hypothetical protein
MGMPLDYQLLQDTLNENRHSRLILRVPVFFISATGGGIEPSTRGLLIHPLIPQ